MAKDIYHQEVKEALIKDGWTITHDGYKLGDGELEYEVDLGAEKLIAATKDKEKILVEIKSFREQSKTYEFHRALEQFNNYFLALEDQEPDRLLFLAVPELVYIDFFQKALVKKAIERFQMKIVVFDPLQKVIVKWLK